MMNKYGFKIQWSNEDEGFIVTSPEFPGLSAFGETEEEALAEAKIARQLFIEDMQESGEALPAPQLAHEFSGQTRLRLSKTLHRVVAEMAESDGISLNQFIVDAINERVGGHRASSQFIGELRTALAENAQQRRIDLASIVWQEDRGTQYRRVVKTLGEISQTFRVQRGQNKLREIKMAEANQILFDYKEVAEALIRKQDLHEGIWGLYIEFGFGATNLTEEATKALTPTALVAVRKIGLQRFPEPNNLTVDAAEINGADKAPSGKRSMKNR